ncbi:MAG: hypothetical protein ACRC9R_11085, partial [Enterovibrio sp.]
WEEAEELFNTDHSKSYDEFKKKIAGFDLEDEQRNNPDSPLVSPQQATEAIGQLFSDALNFTSAKYAEKYNLNLNPKTNPGREGFWQWLDKTTDWAAKAFSKALHQMDQDILDLEKEVEDKSSKELRELDMKLAALAHQMAQRNYIDTDTQLLMQELVKEARKKADIRDPLLTRQELRKLRREQAIKNEQDNSGASRIRQNVMEAYDALKRFVDKVEKVNTLEADPIQEGKATDSNIDNFPSKVIAESQLFDVNDALLQDFAAEEPDFWVQGPSLDATSPVPSADVASTETSKEASKGDSSKALPKEPLSSQPSNKVLAALQKKEQRSISTQINHPKPQLREIEQKMEEAVALFQRLAGIPEGAEQAATAEPASVIEQKDTDSDAANSDDAQS